MAAPLGRCCCRLVTTVNRVNLYRRFSAGHAVLGPIQAQSSANTGDTKPVSVPKRKKRTPTSILEALAETVEKDYDAPHYKYIDDPFLIPNSDTEKRTYSLSRASGQRAAQYVMEQYPIGFLPNPAAPTIKDFMPKEELQHSESTIEGLEERIHRRDPLAAFQSYQALKEAGTSVPMETLESLLELLAYYNSSAPSDELLDEEQFFNRDMGHDKMAAVRKTWKSHGPAEQLFKELPEKTTRAYLALLRGREKYYDVDKAHELYLEMKAMKDMVVPAEAIAVILRLTPFLQERSENRWEMIQNTLAEMAAAKVAPNMEVFNSALYSVSRCSRFRKSCQWCLQIIQEMKEVGLEPNPGSWYYVLRTFYHNDECSSNILNQIVDYLHGKHLTASEPADYEFFTTAMSKCYTNLKDLELAYKIDDLLNTGHNYKLLGDGFKQGYYYTYFMRTLCTFEQIDKVMEIYDRITPHVYTPTYAAYDELLRAIELNEGYSYLPQIWSDFVLFNYVRRIDLIESLLRIMSKTKQDEQLQNIFTRIAHNILEKFEEEKQSRRLSPFQLTGVMIGDMIQISLHGGDHKMAWDVFQIYEENKLNIEKFPSESSLVALSDACIESSEPEKVLKCIKLMVDCAYPKVDEVAAKLSKQVELTQDQKYFLDDLL